MQLKLRLTLFLWLIAVTAAGYFLKFYRGPGQEWVNNWGPASVAYEVMLMLIVALVLPRRERAGRLAVGVFLFTALLEVLQNWHPAWLQAIRSTLLGRAFFGTTFSWWDFPAYLVGCALGYVLLRALLPASVGAIPENVRR